MDNSTFCTHYLPLSDALYRQAFRLLGIQAEAEDVVQDVYLKLWRSRASLDDIRSPEAYAVTLVRNAALDRLRTRPRMRPLEETSVQEPGAGNVEEAFSGRERYRRVLERLRSLPARQREAVVLRTLYGYSYKEIGRQTGASPLTLRVLVSRARKILKMNVK